MVSTSRTPKGVLQTSDYSHNNSLSTLTLGDDRFQSAFLFGFDFDIDLPALQAQEATAPFGLWARRSHRLTASLATQCSHKGM
jgi:hypothetical protein